MSSTAPGRVVVLAYHAIADLRGDPVLAKWSVAPQLFGRQLDAIAAAGWSFVSLGAVLAALRGEGELPRKAVLLSFDDAYADLLSEALPAMERHGAPGVVFAVAAKVGATNSWDVAGGARELDLLDADGLRAVAARGVEVGSHTSHHRPLGSVPAAELDEELGGSAERLAALGLPRPRAFAYPHGDCSLELARAVQAAGYEAAFTIFAGAVAVGGASGDGSGQDRYLLPRIVVLETDSPRNLRLKLATAAWPERWRLRVLRALRVGL